MSLELVILYITAYEVSPEIILWLPLITVVLKFLTALFGFLTALFGFMLSITVLIRRVRCWWRRRQRKG